MRKIIKILLFINLIVLLPKCKQKTDIDSKLLQLLNNSSLYSFIENKGINNVNAIFHETLIDSLRESFLIEVGNNGIKLKNNKLLFFEVYKLSYSSIYPKESYQLLIELTEKKENAYLVEQNVFKKLDIDKTRDAIVNFYNNYPEYSDFCLDVTSFLKNEAKYLIVNKIENDSLIFQYININPGYTKRDIFDMMTDADSCQTVGRTMKYLSLLDAFFIGYVKTGSPIY